MIEVKEVSQKGLIRWTSRSAKRGESSDKKSGRGTLLCDLFPPKSGGKKLGSCPKTHPQRNWLQKHQGEARGARLNS